MKFNQPQLFGPAFRVALPAIIAAMVLAFSTAATAQETPSLPNLSDAQWEKIHSGEVYVDVNKSDSINRGVVVGIVQEEISEVTPLIARCWEYGNWRDNLTDTGFEGQTDRNNIVCSGTAKVPFPLRNRDGHFDVHNRTEDIEGTRSFVSSFDYIEGSGNMEDMFGYWVAFPYGADDEHTLIKHVLNVDIGGWVPGPVMRWATGRTLPNTILGIRTELDDDLSEPPYWRNHDY